MIVWDLEGVAGGCVSQAATVYPHLALGQALATFGYFYSKLSFPGRGHLNDS